MRNFFTILIIISFSIISKAQDFQIGLQTGASVYLGEMDVSSKNWSKQLGFTGGFFGRYSFLDILAVRANFYMGQLKANEKMYGSTPAFTNRGYQFTTTITEFSTQVEFSFLNLDKDFTFERNHPFLSVYALGGVGVTNFNPVTKLSSIPNSPDNFSVDRKTDIDYDRRTAVLPMGMGLKFQINEQLTIGGEAGLRKTFTDNLDGISTSENSFKGKDYYLTTGINIAYKLNY